MPAATAARPARVVAEGWMHGAVHTQTSSMGLHNTVDTKRHTNIILPKFRYFSDLLSSLLLDATDVVVPQHF